MRLDDKLRNLVLLILYSSTLVAIIPATGADHAWGESIRHHSFTIAPIHQFRTDLDQGGWYKMSGFLLHSSVTQSVSESVDAGFGLSYSYGEYTFKNPVFTGLAPPWSEVHTVQGNLFYVRTLDNSWRVQFSPSLRFSGESGAKTSDALAWGGMLSFSRVVNPGLVLGLGIAYIDDIDKRSVFPIVVVRWDITDRLTLGNAPRTGPAGSSGMELSYGIDDNWVMGVGAAWRSNRFRLDRHGFSSGGVARSHGIPVWLRASRSLTGSINFDFYGGAMLSGNLRIDDVHGNRIANNDHSTALFVSSTLSARF